MGSARPIVIDGRGHLLGRLASVVAKQLIAGQKIIVVRCEGICVSGSCKPFLEFLYDYYLLSLLPCKSTQRNYCTSL